MLIIPITFHPHGHAAQARTIARATITNDGTGSFQYGNYHVLFEETVPMGSAFDQDARQYIGHVTQWPRLEHGPWALVAAALDAVRHHWPPPASIAVPCDEGTRARWERLSPAEQRALGVLVSGAMMRQTLE